MKTIEVLQRIQSLYSKGVNSDDTRLSYRHIYNKAISVRSTLLTQELNKRQKVSQWNYQEIPCAELEEATIYNCACLPQIGCTVLKTKYPIPKPLTGYDNHILQSVTSVDGSQIFSEISWIEKNYKKGNRYTANSPDYLIKNHFILLRNIKNIKAINIVGLFDNPLEVEKFKSMCQGDDKSNDCFDIYEYEFPLDNDMIDTLVKMASEELIVMFTQMQEDTSNNSKDSIEQQSK